ncbi:DUF4384 domain-containing protein, partial [Oceaniglobus roseus]|uniref:DUF4384 domain-containing protein n=1 Tax=Oceaniglobus roseus TaxID=1737570 RepID=UPI001C12C10A
ARAGRAEGQALGAQGSGALARPAAVSVPEGTRQTAALAWSGEGTVDPVSLAAIQAFARPGDRAAGEGERVRDAIGGLLASVPCARLRTEFDPETGRLELRGHIPEEGLRAPVLAALRAQLGSSIPVTEAVRILPRPVCGVLSDIGAVGLAQSDDQYGDPTVIGAATQVAEIRFEEGQRMAFTLLGADYPAYFYVDYFDASGTVLHLQPNETVAPRIVEAQGAVYVGSAADGSLPLVFDAAPPFGQEVLAAFASSVPLYDGVRPLSEPAGPYLEFLKARVAAARAADPGFRGEWFYVFVTIAPRS